MTGSDGDSYGVPVRTLIAVALVASLAGCEKLASMMAEEPSREQQSRAWLAKGRSALSKGDMPGAQEALEKAASLNPTDPEPQRTLGGVYEKLGQQAQAILALKRAAELTPGDPGPRKELAELYLRSGQPGAAVDHLKKAVDQSKDGADSDLLRQLAFAQLRSGKVDEAEVVAQQLDKESPGDADTMALLAEVLIAKRQEERAVQLLDSAVEAHPNSPRVRTARAKYFYSRGKVQEALHEFELASQAAPEDTEIGLARARLMASAGQAEEAASLMDEMVKARPTDLNAQSSLAEVKLLADDVAGAREVAEGVIAHQPRNARALYVRARAIEMQSPDDPVRAINAYRQALEAEEDQTESLSRLWRLYLKQGQRGDAISILEKLQVIGDATSEEETELMAQYAETGINVSRGLKMCEESLKKDPGNARLLSIRAQLQLRLKTDPGSRPRGGGGGSGIQVIKGGR